MGTDMGRSCHSAGLYTLRRGTCRRSKKADYLLGGVLYATGGVQYKVIILGIAPSPSGNMVVIGGAGFVGTANILLGFVPGVTIYLHNSLDTVFLRSLNENPYNVFPALQNIVGSTPNNNAASVIHNLFNDSVLCHRSQPDCPGAEIEVVQNLRRVFIDAGYEFFIQPAFLCGQSRHLFVVERQIQLLGHKPADSLPEEPCWRAIVTITPGLDGRIISAG